jgi:hypothetical protein
MPRPLFEKNDLPLAISSATENLAKSNIAGIRYDFSLSLMMFNTSNIRRKVATFTGRRSGACASCMG